VPGPLTLGIDPGVTGAAVLLDGHTRRAVAWYTWRPRGGIGTELRREGYKRTHDTLSQALEHVAFDATARVQRVQACVEGLYVPKDPKRHPSFIVLAEAAGQAVCVCGVRGVPIVARPSATTWRAKVLPATVGRTRKVAEAYARANAHTLVQGLPEKANTHLCEAACIALYGHHYALMASREKE